MTNPIPDDPTAADQLVVRAKIEREAFGRLYDRYFPVICRYCQRRLFDRSAADDVASDVFLQVAAVVRDFPGTTDEDFRRWVYRIATNAINAHLRKTARRGELLEQAIHRGYWHAADADGEGNSSENPQWEAVARALRTLSPRDQAIVTLHYMEGMPYEEIARIVNVRPATVRVASRRAIHQLRRRLADEAGIAISEQRNSRAS